MTPGSDHFFLSLAKVALQVGPPLGVIPNSDPSVLGVLGPDHLKRPSCSSLSLLLVNDNCPQFFEDFFYAEVTSCPDLLGIEGVSWGAKQGNQNELVHS